METPDIELTLIPAPDDPTLENPAYQAELWQFEQSLTSRGVEVNSHKSVQLSEPGSLTYFGDFTIKLVNFVGPVVGTVVGAWLHARYGRKARVKVGKIEVEAQTVEEVEKLLDRAEAIQQRNHPKVIHEQ